MKFASARNRRYLFLVPLFAATLFYQLCYTVVSIRAQADVGGTPHIPFRMYDGRVQSVEPAAANAGLQLNDRILEVDGKPVRGSRDFDPALYAHKPGTRLALKVQPAGNAATRTVQFILQPSNDFSGLRAWIFILFFLAVSFLCIIAGIYAAAVLPNDARALSFLGVMLGTSLVVEMAQWFDFPAPLRFFALAFKYLASMGLPLWMIAFALTFPEKFAWDRRRPWLKWLVLGPLAAALWLLWLSCIVAYFSYQALPALQAMAAKAVAYFPLLLAVSIAFFFCAIGRKLATVQNKDGRRRLRIMFAGSMLGLMPIGLIILYAASTGRNPSTFPEGIIILVCSLFCFFPITLAYVIVVDRALDLRSAVRQGVRYALAKGGLRVVLGLAAAGILLVLSNFLLGPAIRRMGPEVDREVEIGIYVFAAIAVIALVRRTREQLMKWVDRKFFREAYDAQIILEDLSESVRSIVDEGEMLDTVARRISESLHVPQFAVLLNEGNGFRPVYCLGFEAEPELRLPEDSKTVEVLEHSKDGARINFDRKDNWVHSAPETELLTLKAMHTQLLLPLSAKNKLLGILSLGQKLSEEPYSASDVQILRSLSVQTALALENSRLTKAVATEMAQREKLNREIEIAREVQERLFPQRLPAIAGVDYSGACRPALGIGGDYYDFLPFPNGDLGIAVGDVSGKGIAAALLMASLQASLRGQALQGQGDLAQLMANVNQFVYDTTPINRYATFFYGQYQRASRMFRYVNAGHNPPIVLRRTSRDTIHVIRLETGGPVVGLLPGAPYQEGALMLESGDIFVGFTDGISEAMNNQDEEWGEERLIPAIAANSAQPAAEIIPSLMAEADRFVSGAPQHDDMTLVVMKLNAEGELTAAG
ncbi:MAG: SpoIIE family protein phosphatase [Acidobacteriaceae bacterium]|nr:SpoIIE family protein phosphatase [Acidobacteriaceae bacterium]